jgi:phospholipid/cholesterol/gamma-HCH transport system substrate-binding protein
MTPNRNALKSGLFIIATIVATLAVIVGIKGVATWSEPKELRAVSFTLKDDIGGLQSGDDVRVGGFKVGTVERITVVGAADENRQDPPRVRVEFTFPRKYVLHRDALLRIQTGITGSSCLNFESLGKGAMLPVAEEIAGHPGNLSEMLATVSQLGDPLKNILGTVDRKTLPAVNDTVTKFGKTAESITMTGDHTTRLVDDARAQVDPAMKKYHIVADRTAEMMVKVRDLFGDTTPDFRATMANLSAISASISKKAPAIVDRLDGLLAHLDKTVETATAALEDIKATAQNTKELTASAKNVIAGNKGKLDAMITALKATGDNLKNATAEIRRSPWRLLYKPAPNEMANLNLYDAAREFADGANELNDASLALRDAMQSNQTDKQTVEKLMLKVNKTFENFQQVETKLWTKVQE